MKKIKLCTQNDFIRTNDNTYIFLLKTFVKVIESLTIVLMKTT